MDYSVRSGEIGQSVVGLCQRSAQSDPQSEDRHADANQGRRRNGIGTRCAWRGEYAAFRPCWLEPGVSFVHGGLSISEIGRASCRERVCQNVSISGVAGRLKKNRTKQKYSVELRRQHKQE